VKISQEAYEHISRKVIAYIEVLEVQPKVTIVTFEGLWDGFHTDKLKLENAIRYEQQNGYDIIHPESQVRNLLATHHFLGVKHQT
jgi:hypothetical protein